MKKTMLIVIIVLAVMVMGFSRDTGTAVPSQEQQNIEVVKKVFEFFKTRDLPVSLHDLMTEALVEQIMHKFSSWWKEFAEAKIEVNDMFATGDKVAVRWTLYGKKDRMLQEDWQIDSISIFQLDNGKIINLWTVDNTLKALKEHNFWIKPPAPKTFAERLKATMSDMSTIGKAIKYYLEDFGYAPKVSSINELKKLLQPFYIKRMPLEDAWDNDFLYQVDPKDPKNYWLGSAGSDGKFEGFEQKGTWKVEEGEKGQDIVMMNGEFTYMPDLVKKEGQKM